MPPRAPLPCTPLPHTITRLYYVSAQVIKDVVHLLRGRHTMDKVWLYRATQPLDADLVRVWDKLPPNAALQQVWLEESRAHPRLGRRQASGSGYPELVSPSWVRVLGSNPAGCYAGDASAHGRGASRPPTPSPTPRLGRAIAMLQRRTGARLRSLRKNIQERAFDDRQKQTMCI